MPGIVTGNKAGNKKNFTAIFLVKFLNQNVR